MLIPIYDKGEEKLDFPVVTLMLIAINILFFIVTDFYLVSTSFEGLHDTLAFYACYSETFECVAFDIFRLNDPWAYFSYQFVHGDFWHLALNLLFFWVFGDNVEHHLPPLLFFTLFLFCGISAAILFALVNANFGGALIGASGSISGIMAAYMILWPKQKLRILAWFGIVVFWFRVPAWLAIGAWIAQDFYYLTIELEYVTEVAFSAHVGGAIFGALCGFVIALRSKSREQVSSHDDQNCK